MTYDEAKKLFGSLTNQAQILSRFKELAKTRHPDAGGTAEDFHDLIVARDLMLRGVKIAPRASMSEGSFQQKVIKHLGMYLKIHGHTMQASGWPDLLCVYDGRVIFFELKTEIGRLSSLQRVILRRLRKNRVPAYVLKPWLVIEDEDGNVLWTGDHVAEALQAALDISP